MLFYCEFMWHPGMTREQVAQRFTEQHNAGANNPERIKGWYNLAGGGAGFLIVDCDDIKELSAFLEPYMDLASFDMRAINEFGYDDRVKSLGKLSEQLGTEPGVARHDFA